MCTELKAYRKCCLIPVFVWPGWVKGYPPHDTGVNEGEAEIGHQSDRPIETLETEDRFQTRDNKTARYTTRRQHHEPGGELRPRACVRKKRSPSSSF